jgi:1-deoxy-D-xylulose-5-phosphate synthase
MSAADGYLLLDSLELPSDLRRLEITQLQALAGEVRALLSHNVATPPGGLATGQAAVELAIAVHHVFDTSADRIVWDSGDQALAHEVLSAGRNRLYGREAAASGARCGTAIGTALAMAVAAARLGEPRHVVAIVANGALTAGMAFEALNHAGALHADMLVILNDSDPARTASGNLLSNRLAQVLAGPLYSQLRDGGKKVLRQMPTVRELARRSEQHLKGMVLPGTMFEELGFNYIGPLDGHDIGALVAALRNLKGRRGPQFLQVLTGTREAPVGSLPGDAVAADGGARGRGPLGKWLCEMAAADSRVMVVTASGHSNGLDEFARRFPERCLDVSGAHQHAVTFAAGLAVAGLRPVVAISCGDLQCAYDQVIHDVALQNLPVTFAVDRAGHGAYDLSYLRCVPNLTIMAPADENECRRALAAAQTLAGPAVVRIPSDHGSGAAFAATAVLPARARLCREGRSGLALLSFGARLAAAAGAAERLDASLVDMRFVKPLDEELLVTVCGSHRALVTLEDNVIAAGAGAGVAELLAARGLRIPLLQLGIPDRQSERDAQLESQGIGERIERWWRSR